MASDKEVESFVFKFRQLWKSGFQADLQFKCNAGQAYVYLQVGLGGYVTVPSQVIDSKPPKKHVSPSQVRRSQA